MRELISEHPNIVPVGIGNSTSVIDMSTYLKPASNPDDYEAPNSVGASDEEQDNEVIASTTSDGQEITDMDADDGDNGDEIHIPVKRKSTGTPKLNTPAGSSMPSIKQENKKTRTMMEKFSDVAKAQEETVLKSMDVKVRRLELTTDTDIARIKAQERIQVEKDKRRVELKMQKLKLEQEKLRMEHELKLAQLRASHPAQAPATSHIVPPSFSSGSSSHAFGSPANSQLGLELSNEFDFRSISMPHTPLFLPDHQDTTDNARDSNI